MDEGYLATAGGESPCGECEYRECSDCAESCGSLATWRRPTRSLHLRWEGRVLIGEDDHAEDAREGEEEVREYA